MTIPFYLETATLGNVSAAKPSRRELERQTFTTSRELEYFTEAELTTQTGYSREHWWPGVVAKELLDNALDACEQAGQAPQIKIDFRGDSLSLEDNGPGIEPDVVARILDFSTRTSSKLAYVSPTRGAQGNAIKTIAAIPYVLADGQDGIVEIESLGVRHTIKVSTDQILQRPQIDHRTAEIVKKQGTRVRVVLDSASQRPSRLNPDSYKS
jgi:DNA topoisomerase VI subunit B